MKKREFETGGIYHIYNRGTRKSIIFQSDNDYLRWENLLYWCSNYNYPYSLYLERRQQVIDSGGHMGNFISSFEKEHRCLTRPVEILSYVEMPNHFHLVVEQAEYLGVTSFMQRLSTAYTMYFNKLYDMSGSLFEGRYKAVRVVSNPQLIQLLKYVILNPLKAGLVNKDSLFKYPWSSLSEYFGDFRIITSNRLPNEFRNLEKLKNLLLLDLQKDDKFILQSIAID